MARDLTAGMVSAVTAATVAPVLLAEIEVDGGFVRVHSGLGDLVFDGDTYLGTGEFGGITAVRETTEVEADGLQFQLSGVPSALVSTAFNNVRQGLPARLYVGAFDLSTGLLIVDPYLVFEGLTDVPEITDAGETASFVLSSENRLIQLERPKVRRFTDLDQQVDYPGDVGFAFVPSLQDQKIKFGP